MRRRKIQLRSGEKAERRGLHRLLTYTGTEFESSLFQEPFRFLKVLIINRPGKPPRLLRVVYHLKTISGKSGRKVNGTRLFGRSWKASGRNFPAEIRVPFLQSHLWFSGSFRPSRSITGKWNWQGCFSLRSRRLEVVSERENGRARGRHASL